MEEKLASAENQNASLKYNLSIIEEELQIINDEKEKRQTTMSRRISELEAECQRLKTMLRRRGFPSYAAGSRPPSPQLSKFKSLEEEIKVLSNALGKKTLELQSAWIMCARTASKLSRAETQLEELRRCNGGADPSTAAADASDISPAASWASALMSELENFRPKISAPELETEKAASPRSLSSSDSVFLSSFTKRMAELADEIKDKMHDTGNGSIFLQWKSSEVVPMLEGFSQSCNLFMDQKSDLESFFHALVSALEWAAGNCSPSPKTKEQEQNQPLKTTVSDLHSSTSTHCSHEKVTASFSNFL